MNSLNLLWPAHDVEQMKTIDIVFWIICIIYYTIKIVSNKSITEQVIAKGSARTPPFFSFTRS